MEDVLKQLQEQLKEMPTEKVGDFTEGNRLVGEINRLRSEVRRFPCSRHPERTLVALSKEGQGLCALCLGEKGEEKMSISDWKKYDVFPPSGTEKKEALTRAYKSLASALDGLTADDKENYLAVVATPLDNTNIRTGKLGMSGCALVAMGLWRFLGASHDLLIKPYRIGHAVADVLEIGTDELMRFAPESISEQHPPEIGDVIVIGFPEHVFTVITEPEDLGGGHFKFMALHGGRKDEKGVQRIELAETWIDVPKGYACVSRLATTGTITNARSVVAVVKGRFFNFPQQPKLPENWA